MNATIDVIAIGLVFCAVVRLHAAGCYARSLEDELRRSKSLAWSLQDELADVRLTLERSREGARHRFDRAFTPGEN